MRRTAYMSLKECFLEPYPGDGSYPGDVHLKSNITVQHAQHTCLYIKGYFLKSYQGDGLRDVNSLFI